MFKKSKRQANEVQLALLVLRKILLTVIRTREGTALGYPGAKISLKQDDVPTLFPVVEVMLTLPIHRSSTTTVHLGLKRAVSKLPVQIQVMSVHGEFGPVNSDSIFWRVQPTTLVTSAS